MHAKQVNRKMPPLLEKIISIALLLNFAGLFQSSRTNEVIGAEQALRATVKIRAIAGKALTKGSGVVLRSDGLIVTNYHNIENAETLEVQLNDGRKYPAIVVERAPKTDLALLQIEARGLPFVRMASSEGLQIGDAVYAVGSPALLDFSLTGGLVGGLRRRIGAIPHPEAVESFIQTSVPLNPGCSGGPLLNRRGELVGINTAIWSESGRFEGYSFAVPSEIVKALIENYFLKKA